MLPVLCASACDVPLAPGYRIVRQSLQVRFVPGQPAELRVRALYTMENSGSSDLSFVDADLPREHAFGRSEVRVEVDGHEAAAANLPAGEQFSRPDALRIPFDPVWRGKQKRQLSIEYVLRSPEDPDSRIAIGKSSFHLGPRGWLPELLPPKRVLSPYPGPPKVSEFTIRVPANFSVLAGGASRRARKVGDEVELRLRLTPDQNVTYVVAGHYAASAQLADTRGPSAVIWTIEPLRDDPSVGAQQIESAWETLEKDFGSVGPNIAGPHIVESPELRGRLSDESGPAAVAFPAGVLVNPAALALGTGSDAFFGLVSRALAREWFGESLYFADAAEVGMGEGLPDYAAIVIDEARQGSDARPKRVAEYLRRYDEASQAATETPLSAITLNDAAGPRRIAAAKAPLFFIALEDACGQAPMRKGLANLLASERGREVGYADLRSELEQSCHQDFAPMFRLWLNGKGIPRDFRQKYQGRAVGEVARALPGENF